MITIDHVLTRNAFASTVKTITVQSSDHRSLLVTVQGADGRGRLTCPGSRRGRLPSAAVQTLGHRAQRCSGHPDRSANGNASARTTVSDSAGIRHQM